MISFPKTWQSLKNQCVHGEFEYLPQDLSFRKTVREHFSNITLDDLHGVYVVRRMNNNEILYIGKAGTVNVKGQFRSQDLPSRLTNRRGSESSEIWFKRMVEEEGAIMVEYVILSVSPHSPAFVEATLLQAFLNQENKLPRYNKSL